MNIIIINSCQMYTCVYRSLCIIVFYLYSQWMYSQNNWKHCCIVECKRIKIAVIQWDNVCMQGTNDSQRYLKSANSNPRMVVKCILFFTCNFFLSSNLYLLFAYKHVFLVLYSIPCVWNVCWIIIYTDWME